MDGCVKVLRKFLKQPNSKIWPPGSDSGSSSLICKVCKGKGVTSKVILKAPLGHGSRCILRDIP